jgi:peptidoglycan/xylan/chitin deacetylase (PgdA/CDA1 family)
MTGRGLVFEYGRRMDGMRTVLAFLVMLVFPIVLAKGAAPGKLAWLQDRSIFESGLTGTHTVALTFDDGPTGHTAEVLDVLKAAAIPATFFIVGRMAHVHPELLKRIAAEGHLLANHSATHTPFNQEYSEDPQLLADELRDVDDQIRPLMPEDAVFFFRAPYGIWQPEFAEVLNADPVLKQYVGPLYWDEGGDIAFDENGDLLEAADWQCWKRDWDVGDCAEGYLNEIRRKAGGVVLLHCIHSQSSALVRVLVTALKSEDYRFVRLDNLPAYRQYERGLDARAVAWTASRATANRVH